ncbi:MAG: rhodanese-like domain-containing protein [Longimicrobiales bacterium]|nr:rhodanese-like domain-containing protein [Longimicrobiales bacterium]
MDLETFAARVEDPSHVVLDGRPIAAYNGWRLEGEPRGGHVPGARPLPLSWTRYMDWIEELDAMGLESGAVTVYGYGPDDAGVLAEKLDRLGVSDVDVFGGFAEWSADPNRPLLRMGRYEHLVHPGWLRSALGGSDAGAVGESPPSSRLVVCHAHYGNPDDYAAGHIPGAIALDTNRLESAETWNRRTPEELETALTSLGIRHDTTVVVYGRHSFPTYAMEHPGASAGHLGAMRCAAILLYAGVADVRVLNGGIHGWEEAGHALSTEPTEPRPVSSFGAAIPGRPELMVDTQKAREMLVASDAELVSVRSWAEYIGERSGYHYIEKKGRIPGSVFGNCGTDAYHMENYRNPDHTTRAFDEIAAEWAEVGIVPDKHIAFYCGTGWRGSEAFMNAWLMGWPRVSVYDGGWMEWSGDPENPVETGVPA